MEKLARRNDGPSWYGFGTALERSAVRRGNALNLKLFLDKTTVEHVGREDG